MPRVAVVIPARYQSTRLPGKLLLRETGRYLIQHVYERASLASCVDEVLVATDDERIRAAVESFGGKAVMTSSQHRSGTDRVAEAVRSLQVDIVVNVQGDEPEIEPDAIDLAVRLLERYPDAPMSTLAAPTCDPERLRDPNLVKVVLDTRGYALYFSRAPIPASKSYPEFQPGESHVYLAHMGPTASAAISCSGSPVSTLRLWRFMRAWSSFALSSTATRLSSASPRTRPVALTPQRITTLSSSAGAPATGVDHLVLGSCSRRTASRGPALSGGPIFAHVLWARAWGWRLSPGFSLRWD